VEGALGYLFVESSVCASFLTFSAVPVLFARHRCHQRENANADRNLAATIRQRSRKIGLYISLRRLWPPICIPSLPVWSTIFIAGTVLSAIVYCSTEGCRIVGVCPVYFAVGRQKILQQVIFEKAKELHVSLLFRLSLLRDAKLSVHRRRHANNFGVWCLRDQWLVLHTRLFIPSCCTVIFTRLE